MILDVKNSSDIKLLGPTYYVDCYSYWDLQRCHRSFYENRDAWGIKVDAYNFAINLLKKERFDLYNGKIDMAAIDFSKYKDSDDYYSNLSKKTIRSIKESTKRYYSFKEFSFDDFIPDFCEINKSQFDKRENLNSWYSQPESFFISNEKKVSYWKDHYVKWYGLFRYIKGHTQFDKTTNEKLIAYCQIMYDGEMATIGLVFGHVDYLKYGIMNKLMTSAIMECMNEESIKATIYYEYQEQKEWKRRLLFEPTKLKLKF